MKSFLKAISVPLALLTFVMGVKIWAHSTQEPVGDTFAVNFPSVHSGSEFRRYSWNGSEYLVVQGDIVMLAFPSGSPMYVYDADGKLVDWTGDSGDDDAFHARWPGVYSGARMTPDEVAKWPTK